MEHDVLGSREKISGSRGKSEKVVLLPRSEQSKGKFAFLLFTVIFDTSFRPARPLFGKWKQFVQMVNATTERNSPVLNFVYYQFQTLTDQFADVNG